MSFVGFACGEPSLEKIELSISDSSVVFVGGNKGYVVEKEEDGNFAYISIEATMSPSSFSASDLSWSSSDTSVAIVNDGVAVCKWTGSEDGTTKITATYSKGDESKSASILLTVTTRPLPKFESEYKEVVYTGEDLKGSFKVSNEEYYTEGFKYEYSSSALGAVNEIVDCGRYFVRFVKETETGTLEYDWMNIVVVPYKVELKAISGTSKYGKPLQENFYNTYTNEVIQNEGLPIMEGIGKDKAISIGNMIYTTNATDTSQAGKYTTSIAFIKSNNNYEITVKDSYYDVEKRTVIVKVNDQTKIYGERADEQNFSLYDYDEYKENGNTINGLEPLSTDKINYKNDVSAPNTYLYKQGDEKKNVNSVELYDAGTYQITYESVDSLGNLESITIIEPGTLTIKKKTATVVPNSHSKEYGKADPVITYKTSDIISGDDIDESFLYIDYSASTKDANLGVDNCKAPAGEYQYKIDNSKSKNKNYSLEIDKDSTSMFTVKKCNVELCFENQDFFYKVPTSNDIHTVTYFESEKVDYIVALSKIIVYGEEETDFMSEENKGGIVLPLKDEFYFGIKLSEDKSESNYYMSYIASLDSGAVTFTTGNKDNYEILCNTFKVNLKKIILTVTPCASEDTSSKTFDAVSGEDEAINTFLSQYVLSCSDEIENKEELLDINRILVAESSVLSLRDGDGKYSVLVGDNTSKVDKIRDVGSYKVFLTSNLQYNEGMEYIDFVLDSTSSFYFEITPKNIIIVPKSNQKKIYCESDPTLLYDEDATTSLAVVDDTLVKTGKLSRDSGESCYSQYQIGLGTLSYGSNYYLELSPTPVYFAIEKRNVTVKPFSYPDIVYGKDQEIGYNYYVEGSYDKDLYAKYKPEFEGAFNLTSNNELVSKINGFYPVRIVSNNVDSYKISQGTFNVKGNNYNLIFDDTSTYLVNPRDIYIDIVSKTYSVGSEEPTAGEVLDISINSNFPLASTSQLIVVTATEYAKSDDTYYVESLEKLNVKISFGENDLTSCYNVNLGQSVVYKIESEEIKFKIVTKTDFSKYQTKTTYDGTSKHSLFTLAVETPGYSFANDENNKPSSYTLVFSNSAGLTTLPTNVGSYMVDLKLDSGGQLVVKKDGADKAIVFTSFNKIESNCIAVLSQKGFLTIEKTTLSYDESLLGFEKEIYYGDTVNDLPNIMTTNGGKNVFWGVNNSSINLKTFDGKNYEFKSTTSIEMLDIGTHNILVAVTVAKDSNEEDANYEKLSIQVPLKVIPREIEINGNSVSLTCYQGDNLVYNGNSKSFNLSVETNLSNRRIEYEYIKLKAVYDEDVSGKLQKFKYDSESKTITPVMSGENCVYTTASDLTNIIQTSVSIVNYSSQEYVVLGTGDCYLRVASSSTQDAGIYICIAKIVANSNYILKMEGGTETFSQVQYLKFFEIKKTSAIEIVGWKTDFPYETVFNVTMKSTLPFELVMSPDYKDDVEYITDKEEEWDKECNYILPVGAYEIEIKVDTDNCYFVQKMQFNVVCREAQVIFSETNDTYQYSENSEGNPIAVTNFTKGVIARYTKKDNTVVEVEYEQNPDVFKFTYYDSTGVELADGAPGKIGEYYVVCEYKEGNYAGSARFDYRITKRRYQGIILATDKIVEYKPTYTRDELRTIMQSMLTYDDETSGVDKIAIRDGLTGEELDFDSAGNDGWVKDFVNCEKPRKVRFVIRFKDKTIADRDDITAELTFNQINISSDILSSVTSNVSFVYVGQPIYKELKFNGVSSEFGTNGIILTPKNTKSIVSESKGQYTITYGKAVDTEIDTSYISINDGLGNLIFTLKYNYYKDGSLMTSYPISPGDYAVEYQIVETGLNYRHNISSTQNDLKIEKTTTLTVSARKPATMTYTGNDLSKEIDDNLIEKVVNSKGENVNYKLFKNSNSFVTGTYNENNGICLIYTLYDSSSTQVQEIVNVGTYKVTLSLLAFSTFDPTIYFGMINLNDSVSKDSSTLVPSGVGYNGVEVTYTFSVEKTAFPYSIETEDKVKEFAKAFSLTNYRIVEESPLCSDTHQRQISGYNSKNVITKYDDCNPFGMIAEDFGEISSLSAHNIGNNSNLTTDIANLSSYFANFMNLFTIPSESYCPEISADGLTTYKTFYDKAIYIYLTYRHTTINFKSPCGDSKYSAIIGLSSPYLMEFGNGTNLTIYDYQKAVANLFGFTQDNFTSLVETFVTTYNAYKSDMTKTTALGNGCFYTNNYFVFPIVVNNDVTSTILTYVILDTAGHLSIWVNDVVSLLKAVNFNSDYTTDGEVVNELYCKIVLFYNGIKTGGKKIIEIANNGTFEVSSTSSTIFSLRFGSNTTFESLTVDGTYTEYTVTISSNKYKTAEFTIRKYSGDLPST